MKRSMFLPVSSWLAAVLGLGAQIQRDSCSIGSDGHVEEQDLSTCSVDARL